MWRVGNQEQAGTAADHLTSSVVLTRRRRVALVEANHD